MGKNLVSRKGLWECEGLVLLLGLGEGAAQEASPVLFFFFNEIIIAHFFF